MGGELGLKGFCTFVDHGRLCSVGCLWGAGA